MPPGSGALTMSREMLNSTAFPVFRLMVATIITSVRRLQRPGPASPPASRMVSRSFSRRWSRGSKGASYGVASTGVMTGRTGWKSSSGSQISLANWEALGGRVEGVIRIEVVVVGPRSSSLTPWSINSCSLSSSEGRSSDTVRASMVLIASRP